MNFIETFNRIAWGPVHRHRAASGATYWESIRDTQKGKRGFVIGNGPSLNMKDLEQLKGEVSIASNKIFLAYDQVSWRPNYYTVVDLLVWEKIAAIVHEHEERILLPSYLPKRSCKTQMCYWKDLGRVTDHPSEPPPFCTDAGNGFYWGASVTYQNLQLAAHLGLEQIYLIGCDHYYHNEDASDGSTGVITHQGKDNHFIKGYRTPGEKVFGADLKTINIAYEAAERFSRQNGFRIFNATRGGHLETFERVDFDSLFDS